MSLTVYRVDMNELLSCFGCGDTAGLQELFETNADIIEDDDDPMNREDDPDAPTLREVLTALIMTGKIADKQKYVFALEALIRHLGEQIDFIEKIDYSEHDASAQVNRALKKKGVPPGVRLDSRVPCTLPSGFPAPSPNTPINVMEPAEIEAAIERLQPLDVMGFKPGGASYMVRFFNWLQAAKGQSLVLFFG
ncbi:MAG TPA: hypothetical protein VKX17_05315 [Planctomycetota bacterium]|nr:hypothetical protein [Planctomycetota bacterium]